MRKYNRIFLIVLDSLGIGAMADSEKFGDVIVTKGVEATLRNVGRLGKEGMRETNEEIIKMMIED